MATGMANLNAAAPVDPAACANCGANCAKPQRNFGPACGQESTVRAPKRGEFLQQFGGAYVVTEGALHGGRWRWRWLLRRFALLTSAHAMVVLVILVLVTVVVALLLALLL